MLPFITSIQGVDAAAHLSRHLVNVFDDTRWRQAYLLVKPSSGEASYTPGSPARMVFSEPVTPVPDGIIQEILARGDIASGSWIHSVITGEAMQRSLSVAIAHLQPNSTSGAGAAGYGGTMLHPEHPQGERIETWGGYCSTTTGICC